VSLIQTVQPHKEHCNISINMKMGTVAFSFATGKRYLHAYADLSLDDRQEITSYYYAFSN
jgi:hypothetical protein